MVTLRPDDPLLWGVVFLLVFLVEVAIVMNLRAQKSATAYERPSQEAVLAEGEDLTDILSRFVMDKKGAKLGETVGMDGALVIVKAREAPHYRAIPRMALEARDDAFHIVGEVDWDDAARTGEAWRERQHKLVTYTEDELPKDEREAKAD